jgi:hypothetical protein
MIQSTIFPLKNKPLISQIAANLSNLAKIRVIRG